MKHSWAVSIWNDGDYFDFWHVNHFLAGALGGCLTLFLGLSVWTGLSIGVILCIAWEVLEFVKGIEETKFNTFFDVALSVVAFFLVFYAPLSSGQLSQVFWVVLIVWLILVLWSYWAYTKRNL